MAILGLKINDWFLEKRRRCLIWITPNEIRGYSNPPINNAEGVGQRIFARKVVIQHLRRCQERDRFPALHTGLSRLNKRLALFAIEPEISR